MNAYPSSRLGRFAALLLAVLPGLASASTWRPIADSRTQNAVWMFSATTGMAVGNSGLVRRTTDGGTTWTTESPGVTVNLNAVWGTDASHVWVVGDGGTVVYWNGTTWAKQNTFASQNLRGVFGTATNNVLTVGDTGIVKRFNGSSWSNVTTGLLTNLRAVWAASATNFFIVGDSGRVLKWTGGTSAAAITSGTAQNLLSVSGTAANSVWVAGANGTIRFFDGSTWAAQASGATNALTGIAAADATHVWAAGVDGIVRFFDGSTWATAYTTSPITSLQGVAAAGSTRVIAVGASMTTLVWDGATWTASTSPTPAVAWNSVWGTDDSDMWVVGNGGNILRWNGAAWSSVASGTTENLLHIWGIDNSNIYAVGTNGTILRWNGAAWSPMTSGTTSTVTDIWGTSPSFLFATTSGKQVFIFNGSSWQADRTLSDPLNAVWGFAGPVTNVWFGGDFTSITHLYNNLYGDDNTSGGSSIHGMWGAAPGKLLAVGDSGLILHNINTGQNSQWLFESVPTVESFRGVGGSDSANVWAAGGKAVYYYNGTKWTDDVPAKNMTGATGVWSTGPGSTFITSSDGIVFVNFPAGNGEISLEMPAGTPLLNNTTIAFGTVIQPAVVTKTITINSIGPGALNGIGVALSGTDASKFTLTPPASSTLAGGASTTFDVSFTPVADGARTARLTITSSDPDESPIVINLTATGQVLPSITTQPLNKTVNPNAAATFTVVAAGTGLSYAWEVKDPMLMTWGPAPGAANSKTYTIAHCTEANQGEYHVVVTNAAGSVTSNTVTLTVNNPVIYVPASPAAQLAPAAKVSGDTVSFTVTLDANTTTPVTYVWLRNGVAITGATVTNSLLTNTFTIPSVTVANGGEISCLVKNIASPSGVQTNKVQLTVVDGAAKRFILPTGGTATLTAATGGGVTSFVWKRGTPLSSPVTLDANHIAVANKLTIKNLTLGDDDIYTYEVTGPGGTVTSGPIDLIVVDSAPALAIGETTPLNLGTAIVGGDYTTTPLYDLSAHVDTATNRTPSSYVCAGLPAGLKCDVNTGKITGKPAVALTADKTYTVTITISNAKGKITTPTAPFTLTGTLLLKPLPTNLAGAYVGPIARDASTNLNSNRGGRFDATITATGTYTGKVTLGTLPYAFGGSVTTTVGSTIATATSTILRKAPLSNLTVTFTIDSSLHALTAGSVSDGVNTATIAGWHNKWSAANQATAYAGLHTFKLEGPGAGDPAAPQGCGYGSFTPVVTTGTATASGKLADGVAYSTASFLGPNGELLIFQASTTTDCVLGNLVVAADANHTITSASLDWSRAPQAATAVVYKTGFGPGIAGHALVSLTAGGGKYTAPLATATPPANILLNASNAINPNAHLDFSDAELGDGMKNPAPEPDIDLLLSPTVKVTNITPAATATRSTAIVPVAASGLFSGSFKLVDPRDPAVTTGPLTVTRTSLYYGIVVFEAGVPKGYGYFLLARRPVTNTQTVLTTEQLSGKVIFSKL